MENVKNEFKNSLSAKINNSSYHQLYKEFNYELGANGYFIDRLTVHVYVRYLRHMIGLFIIYINT